MPTREASMEEMLSRTARFKELVPSKEAFVDMRIPGCERDIFTVIGSGVTEDVTITPAITAAEDFNVTYIGADPGKSGSLHSHDTVEVFFAMTGRWSVFWGDKGDQEMILEPLDMVSVPAGVMRGFRNIGENYAYMMTIVGGTDAGRVLWPEAVLMKARETGLKLDADGNLEK